MSQAPTWFEEDASLRNVEPCCARLRFVYGPDGWRLAPSWVAYGPGPTRTTPHARRIPQLMRRIAQVLRFISLGKS